MHLTSVSDLKAVLAVVSLWIAIWVVLSGPAWIAKRILDAYGFAGLPSKALEMARRLGLAGGGLSPFFDRASAAVQAGKGSVRVYVDEKQRRLKQAIASSEQILHEHG